jgi:hypothetical protein
MKQFSAVLVLGLSVLGSAQAQTTATPFNTPGPFVQYNLDLSAGNAGQTTAFTNQWVNVSGPSGASGTVTVAGLGSTGVAKIGLSGSGSDFNAFAWSGWNDTITVTSASAAAGTAGKLQVQVGYDWSASYSGTGTADAYVDMNLIKTGTKSQYTNVTEGITQSCTKAGGCGGGTSVFATNGALASFANGVATFTFNIVFGDTYSMVVGMNADVQGSGAMSIDATHSATWGGVAAVTANGLSVAYQVSSGSGFDYSQPAAVVPEPPALALALAGLAGLGGWRRWAARARG